MCNLGTYRLRLRSKVGGSLLGLSPGLVDSVLTQLASEWNPVVGHPTGVTENYLMCGKRIHLVSEVWW